MILRNVLSQFLIVKCFSKSLLVRIFFMSKLKRPRAELPLVQVSCAFGVLEICFNLYLIQTGDRSPHNKWQNNILKL